MLMPPPPAGDLRWDADVAGGGLMDVGCYAVHAIRDMSVFAGGEPSIVRAWGGEVPAHPGIDAWLGADLEYPSGLAATMECGMTHGVLDFSLRIVGSNGEAYAPAFLLPHMDDRLFVTVGTDQRVEELGSRSSYTYMLEALARTIREDAPFLTDADDAVVTMQMIDDLYVAAGMQPRRTTTLD
jgi:predicted dehydrogenase